MNGHILFNIVNHILLDFVHQVIKNIYIKFFYYASPSNFPTTKKIWIRKKEGPVFSTESASTSCLEYYYSSYFRRSVTKNGDNYFTRILRKCFFRRWRIRRRCVIQ
jgi:hypothetical protein